MKSKTATDAAAEPQPKIVFQELVELKALQHLQDEFTAITGLATAILDPEGQTLTRSGWSELCAGLHPQSPAATARCRKSYRGLVAEAARSGSEVIASCDNGLWVTVIPIFAAGLHLATVSVGQVFFGPPDEQRFRDQARELGLDEEPYLRAVRSIPVVPREEFLRAARIFADVARLVCDLIRRNWEQKVLDEKLAREQARLDAIFQGSGDAMRVVGRDYRVLDQNRAMERLSGVPRDRAVGEPCFGSFHHASCQTEDCILGRILSGEEHLRLDAEMTRPDGSRVDVSITATPLKNQGGETVGVIESFRDITERKRALRALCRERDFSTSLVQASPAFFVALSLDGKVLMMNSSMLRALGYESEDVVGLDYLATFVPEADRGMLARVFQRVVETGKPSMNENRVLCRDGRELLVEWHGRPVWKEDGSMDFFFGTGTDVTERRRAEDSLRVSEARYRALVEDMPALICRFLPDGTLTFVNDAYCRYFGKQYEELVGQSFLELIPEQDRAEVVEHFGSLSPDKPLITYEHTATLADGTVRWQCWTDRALFDDRGRLVEYQSIGEDITDRKRAEEQLRYLSLHDPLTGLYNRTYFEEEMRRFRKGRKVVVGIIVCDLDGLKLVNDTLGHDAGDALLVAAAEVLRKSFRQNDVVARIGGDEFAVLLPRTDRNAVASAVARIRESVAEHNAGHADVPLSISIGSAIGQSTEGMDNLFKKADDSMYREKLHQSRSARSAIVQSLMKALEARDYITEGHADRLQRLVTSLAKAVGLPEQRVADLRLLALFHDLGKVGVTDRILFEPGPLNVEETAEMRRHSEIGHRIALASPDLAPIADWILKHHEWWNGEGYPLGLKGEEIPLECRMLAIADAYDAMVSDRPYRKAMSHAEAVAELKNCAGTQFDPVLVERFLEVLKRRPSPATAG